MKEVEKVATALNLDKKSRLYETITEWKKSPPDKMGETDRFIRIPVEKDVALRVELKYRDTIGGWTALFEFTVPSLFGLPQPNEQPTS